MIVGSVPGTPGAPTQGETIEEVQTNLLEVDELLRSEHALASEGGLDPFRRHSSAISTEAARFSRPDVRFAKRFSEGATTATSSEAPFIHVMTSLSSASTYLL